MLGIIFGYGCSALGSGAFGCNAFGSGAPGCAASCFAAAAKGGHGNCSGKDTAAATCKWAASVLSFACAAATGGDGCCVGKGGAAVVGKDEAASACKWTVSLLSLSVILESCPSSPASPSSAAHFTLLKALGNCTLLTQSSFAFGVGYSTSKCETSILSGLHWAAAPAVTSPVTMMPMKHWIRFKALNSPFVWFSRFFTSCSTFTNFLVMAS
mmetsp:Transcript_82399/g.176474  ORF Transcript_82399/g.176474 Transcript_82399/m.176474 type:complete len:212 (+) Transcript_82399:186-821(+)